MICFDRDKASAVVCDLIATMWTSMAPVIDLNQRNKETKMDTKRDIHHINAKATLFGRAGRDGQA